MSRTGYQSRLRNLAHVKCKHTYEQTRRNEREIALATHRGENYRAMAKRLGLSHTYCWRVAQKYRAGLIPMLPRNEQELLALRDSLASEPPDPLPSPGPGTRPAVVLDGHGWNCECAGCRSKALIDAAIREARAEE